MIHQTAPHPSANKPRVFRPPLTAEERLELAVRLRRFPLAGIPDDLVTTGEIGSSIGRKGWRVRKAFREAGIHPVEMRRNMALYARADLERYVEVTLKYEEQFKFKRWWPDPFGGRVKIAHDPGITR